MYGLLGDAARGRSLYLADLGCAGFCGTEGAQAPRLQPRRPYNLRIAQRGLVRDRRGTGTVIATTAAPRRPHGGPKSEKQS
eukprot:121639-Chlamydomonas_euryale.AAC.11